MSLRMPQWNKLELSGRITREPETRQVSSGSVCNTALAVDEGFGDKKKTFFIDVTGFGKTADIMSALAKGAPVMIEGRLDQDAWDDKTTGQKRTKMKMIANRVHPLEWPRKDDGEAQAASGQAGDSIPEDDVPF